MLTRLSFIYPITFLWFIFQRMRMLMQFFQQEEYDNRRFLLYVVKHRNLIDKKLSLAIAALYPLTYFTQDHTVHVAILAATLSIFALRQDDPTKAKKKPLVVTFRVKRLFAGIMLLASLCCYGIYVSADQNAARLYLSSILLIQAIPLLLVSANLLFIPLEKLIQLVYLNAAKAKLAKYKPIIIGITGSYGKTSTKHILAHILSTVAPTLATPGSINTTMGITKIIREQLKPEHKFFIVEMGAYGIGSIARICKLTPPTHGIITAIGNAHFERFKSAANVAQTKFELGLAVKTQSSGFLVVNGNAIEPQFMQKYCNQHTITVQTSADGRQADYTISHVEQTLSGINFQISCNNEDYSITTNLYGLHHAENMALCFALAHKMGIAPATICAALSLTPQIRHRLEVIQEKAKPIVIDDAYNSNPTGFSAALEVLQTFKTKGYRSILVTPGMVELGALHNEKHFELGVKVAAVVDYVLVIIPQRIQTFVDGFNSQATGMQKLLTFNTFSEAKTWLHANAKESDVILLENDLPDLYESRVNL